MALPVDTRWIDIPTDSMMRFIKATPVGVCAVDLSMTLAHNPRSALYPLKAIGVDYGTWLDKQPVGGMLGGLFGQKEKDMDRDHKPYIRWHGELSGDTTAFFITRLADLNILIKREKDRVARKQEYMHGATSDEKAKLKALKTERKLTRKELRARRDVLLEELTAIEEAGL